MRGNRGLSHAKNTHCTHELLDLAEQCSDTRLSDSSVREVQYSIA